MTSNTDTPRTDAHTIWAGSERVVRQEYARQLERELSAANARIAELEKDAARAQEDAQEWKTQHENLLAIYQACNRRIGELKGRAERAEDHRAAQQKHIYALRERAERAEADLAKEGQQENEP